MKSSILAILFVLFCFGTSWGQVYMEEDEEPSFKDRLYFGGGGAFQLNQYYFLVGASPIVGYMINERLSAGTGITYQYTSYRNLDISTHTYGGRLFTRYNLFKNVFSMAEYEMLSMQLPTYPSEDLPRIWVDRLLVGGGYFQPIGRRGGFNLGVLYDLFFQYGGNSPYNSPWVFRVGFTF